MKNNLLTTLTTALLLLVSSQAAAYEFLYTCGPSWRNLPITYYINQNGSNDMSFSTLEQVIDASYGAWEQPCCSKFRAQYGGQTANTAVNNNDRIVLSFEENSWDPQFGSVNVTIGVTLTSVWNDCSIADAPILFNGVGFQFTNNGTGTDLQAIATHEIGHMLGLSHSPIQQATMFASYVGGTGARSLHQDDIDGVCALYNKACTCITSNDCTEGDICQNGICREVACTSTSQCQDGLTCDLASGKCIVPPCTSDLSCPSGFYCASDATCKSRCPVCRDCDSNADCGLNGVCTQAGKCVTFCQQGGLCPGDSSCYDVNGSSLCLNDNADTAGICPEDYVCIDATPAVECTSDIQCSAAQICQNNKCVPRPDPCDGLICNSGESCVNGTCVATGNNTTGNNTTDNNATGNNTTSNNTTSNNAAGNNTVDNNAVGGQNNDTGNTNGSGVIIFLDEETPDDGCSQTSGGITGMWPILLALGFLRRRR